MLYPCFVARFILRYQKWKQPYAELKHRRRYNQGVYVDVVKKIKMSVRDGKTFCYEIGLSEHTVKYLRKKLMRRGYDVGIYDINGKYLVEGEIKNTETYSICVNWE